MTKITMPRVLTVYGLTYQDGKLSADAAWECTRKELGELLTGVRPTELHYEPADDTYMVGKNYIRGENVFNLKRLETSENGCAAWGNIPDAKSQPSDAKSDSCRLSVSSITANKGILLIIAEHLRYEKLRALRGH